MTATAPWETVIGLEVHAQLKTRTKLFSACPVAGGALIGGANVAPNTFTDEVVLALPGTLPVPNAQAIRLAVRLGLALGCTIDRRSQFSRKHYFYPDLPKGYQVSQYEDPICGGGAVPVTILGAQTTFQLRRIHLEEDAGKTIHDARRGESRVDLNRAGVALVEIVSEPVLGSSAEAVAYLKALHRLVVWLEVSDGDMEAGNFRCDANVSVRKAGGPLGTRTEIKNVNSFKFVGAAIDAEVVRQIQVLEQGGAVIQETRGWDEHSGQTRSLRMKEDAHDYRYFPDPDLLVLDVPEALYDELAALPELPHTREARFRDLGLSPYDAEVLTQDRARADFFEAVLQPGVAEQPRSGVASRPSVDEQPRSGVASRPSVDEQPRSGVASRPSVDEQPRSGVASRPSVDEQPRSGVASRPSVDPKTAANWLINDLLGALAKDGLDLAQSKVTPLALATLLAHFQRGTLSSRMAKDALAAMLAGADGEAWVKEHGGQVSDASALVAAIDPILDANASQVAELLSGKEKVFGFFVGQAMRALKGKANPEELQRILRERLEARRPS